MSKMSTTRFGQGQATWKSLLKSERKSLKVSFSRGSSRSISNVDYESVIANLGKVARNFFAVPGFA